LPSNHERLAVDDVRAAAGTVPTGMRREDHSSGREEFARRLRAHFVLAHHVGKQLDGRRREWLPRNPAMPTTPRIVKKI
jgi:hypothetical protein